MRKLRLLLSLKSIGMGGADGAPEVLGSFKFGAIGAPGNAAPFLFDIGIGIGIVSAPSIWCMAVGWTEITMPEFKFIGCALKLSRIGIVPIVIGNSNDKEVEQQPETVAVI